MQQELTWHFREANQTMVSAFQWTGNFGQSNWLFLYSYFGIVFFSSEESLLLLTVSNDIVVVLVEDSGISIFSLESAEKVDDSLEINKEKMMRKKNILLSVKIT